MTEIAEQPLWRGQKLNLHTGARVFLKHLGNERAAVRRYCASTSRWTVELERFPGREMHVAEENLIFGFTLLPENAVRVQRHVALTPIASHGGCGRGLLLSASVVKGSPLWQEFPMVVTQSGVQSMYAPLSACLLYTSPSPRD